MHQEKIDRGIVPPVIVDENGDVQPYPSVESAIRAVEAVDVANHEYAFYDATGRVLEGRVQKGRINLIPTSKFESDSPLLRRRILDVYPMEADLLRARLTQRQVTALKELLRQYGEDEH